MVKVGDRMDRRGMAGVLGAGRAEEGAGTDTAGAGANTRSTGARAPLPLKLPMLLYPMP